jgi:hypothetical protein
VEETAVDAAHPNLALPGMFTETAYAGGGFGLGFSVMQSPARADRRDGG